MVKKFNSRNEKGEDEELRISRNSGSRRRGNIQDFVGKSRGLVKELWTKTTASRLSCAVNGSEWGNCVDSESDGSPETLNSERMSPKRVNSSATAGAEKKGKVVKSWDESEEEMEREVKEFKVIVRVNEEKALQTISPVRLSMILKNQVGNINNAKVLRDGNLMISCNTEEQKDRACRMKEIGKYKVTSVSLVQEGSKWKKGVIWGIPIEVSDEEIKSNLRGGKIKNVRRLQTFKNGEKTYSESILIEFDEENLPERVYLGYLSYNVREYVPRPIRCFKCQRFGHTAQTCKGKRRCARCGEDHEYEECNKSRQPKCCNCGGSHSVAYGGCEIMKREVQVQQVRVRNKISYAEAVKVVKQRTEVGAENRMNTGLNQTKENKMYVDLRKLVTFIAGVINATMEIKSKTERIQVIVKAAANHLNINEMTWEEVRDDLSAQASQETAWIG